MKTMSRFQTMFMVLLVFAVLLGHAAPAAASDVKSAPTNTGKPGGKVSASPAASDVKSAPSASAGKPDGKESAAPAETVVIPVKVPLFSPLFANFPIALVEDDPVTLKELAQALAASHEERIEGKEANKEHASGKKKYLNMVNRLVMLRLIAHEARNMGLNELPEVKETISSSGKQLLRDLLVKHALENVKPDETEAETIYQDMAREYKLKSALFEKDGPAKKASDEIAGGKDFDETIKKYVESHEARVAPELEGKYLKRGDLLRDLVEVVSQMKVGSVSTPQPIERGWVILKLVDSRPPQQEDLAARQEARQLSLDNQRHRALTAFKKGLLNKYAKLNLKLYNKLDYDSDASAFEKLRKDQRVIAKIEGEKPLTVAEFTEQLEPKLYHGVKSAQESRSINEKKPIVLNEILGNRLELKAALEAGIDKTDQYKDDMKRFEEAVLFNKFIQKVIVPDLRVGEDEQRTYYESHKKEFTRGAMLKLSGLAFKAKKDADGTVARLRKGVDFNWLKANADGVVADAEELPAEKIPLIVSSLPEGLQKVLEGAKEGDIRVYNAANGLFYVVLVTGEVPEEVQPFEAVNMQIRTKLINDQITKSLEGWSTKLRGAYAVTVYLSESEK